MLSDAFDILELFVVVLGYEGDAGTLILLSILVFSRFATLSFAVSALGFGKRAIAGRFAFALALTALGLPTLPNETVIPGGGFFIILLLKEVSIGFCFGFVLSLVFEAARSAGDLIRHQTGIGSETGRETEFSIISDFKVLTTSLLFFVSGAYVPVVNALVGSLNSIPVNTLSELPAESAWSPLVVNLVAVYFLVTITIAMPVVLVLLIADILSGVIQRIVPEITVYGLAAPIKVLLLMTTLAIVLGILVDRLGSTFGDMTNAIERLAGIFV